MGYKLLSICDDCGAEHEIPMATIEDVRNQTYVFVLRLGQTAVAPPETLCAILCAECAKKPAPPGAAVIHDRDKIKVTPPENN